MDNLGEIIKIARIKKKLSQEKLAQILGVTKGAISSWENNRYAPDGKVLVKLAMKLDIVEQLFPGYIKRNAAMAEKENARLAGLEKRVAALEQKVNNGRLASTANEIQFDMEKSQREP